MTKSRNWDILNLTKSMSKSKMTKSKMTKSKNYEIKKSTTKIMAELDTKSKLTQ